MGDFILISEGILDGKNTDGLHPHIGRQIHLLWKDYFPFVDQPTPFYPKARSSKAFSSKLVYYLRPNQLAMPSVQIVYLFDSYYYLYLAFD